MNPHGWTYFDLPYRDSMMEFYGPNEKYNRLKKELREWLHEYAGRKWKYEVYLKTHPTDPRFFIKICIADPKIAMLFKLTWL